MPLDDRLDKENVAYIHHGILCSHKKRLVCVLCRDIDEPGNHHSQQTDRRTENKTPHFLIHRWVLNSEGTRTPGGEHHTQLRGTRGQWKVGRLGRDSMGRNVR